MKSKTHSIPQPGVHGYVIPPSNFPTLADTLSTAGQLPGVPPHGFVPGW